MRAEVQQIVDGLRSALEKTAGDAAKRWTDEDRKVIESGLEAIGKYAFLSKVNPDLAELDRPIIESIVARQKSLSTEEASSIVHDFLNGALEVLKVALPVLFAIIPK